MILILLLLLLVEWVNSSSEIVWWTQLTFFQSRNGTCTGTSQTASQIIPSCKNLNLTSTETFTSQSFGIVESFFCSRQNGLCKAKDCLSASCHSISAPLCLTHTSNSTSLADVSIQCVSGTKKPSKFPTKTPTFFPTTSPITSIPSRTPSNSPSTTIPTVSPTNQPTKRPTHFSPTKSPTLTKTNHPSHLPTFSPSKNPTSIPEICLKPRTINHRSVCEKTRIYCAQFGIGLKFAFKTCTPPQVGGCECAGFCAYACARDCQDDDECYWIDGICLNKQTNIPGLLVLPLSCSASESPTTSPVTKAPTKSPSSSNPSKSPIHAPTPAFTQQPSSSPFQSTTCSFQSSDTCFGIQTCGNSGCFCYHVPGTTDSGKCGPKISCANLDDCTSNAPCPVNYNCVDTCCGSTKCIPNICD